MLSNILSQALQSLRSNRLRSFLTMLGVVWGTASVVFLLGWGKGFAKGMHETSRSVGEGFIFFWPKKAQSAVSGRKGGKWLSFEMEDIDAIQKHCPSVKYVTPVDGGYGQLLKRGNNLKAASVFGVSVEAPNIFNLRVAEGRFLQPHDLDNNRRVIVIGANLKDALFPPGFSPLGSKVKVNGISLEVIGVLVRKGETLVDWGGQEDDKAYIPITTFTQYVRGSRKIYEAAIQPVDQSKSEECVEEVRATLARQLDFDANDKEAVEFIDISRILKALDVMAIIAGIFVSIIGVITLFVGGIGVMNIMLISVTERTREIGIRKAIGAKRQHILSQFMAEALTITMISGLVGIGLGCILCIAFTAVPKPAILGSPEISFMTIGGSLLVMVLVGLFSGFLPALRAARMDPIESLRVE